MTRLGPIAAVLIRLINILVPKQRQAVVAVFPDLDSSTPVLIKGLQRQNIRVVLVLTSKTSETEVPAGVVVCKVGTPRCLWLFMRSRWLLFSHPRFVGMTCARQLTINLWHGMTVKTTQMLDGDPNPVLADLTVASAQVFVPLLAAAFGVPEESVQVLPHPKLEALVRGPGGALLKLGVDHARYRTVVAWMPTYRGRLAHQGGDGVSTGLLISDSLLAQLSTLLQQKDSLLLLRRHPYEAQDQPLEAPHVFELTDKALRAAGLGTYDVLAEVDGLISDTSSVWVDFLYRDRPTLIYFPDRWEYENDRRLALTPLDDWTPSPVVDSETDLLRELASLLSGEDVHRDRRHSVSQRLIEAPPTGSVEAILAAAEARRFHTRRRSARG